MTRTAAILLSRQALRPCRRDTWVQATARAVDWVRRNGHTLVTSAGAPTWELPLALASEAHIPVVVVVSVADDSEFASAREAISLDFTLDPQLTSFKAVVCDINDKPAGMFARDEAVVETADILLPVSIRPGGTMDELLKWAAEGVKTVVTDFQTGYGRRTVSLGYMIDPHALNPELNETGHRHLVHWSRTCNGKWPGETARQYYLDVAKSPAYPRSAYDTLRRIVAMRRVIASGRHMPSGTKTVSFTGLACHDVVPLMRWRARYRQMSFEPYGIGITRHTAARDGIGPVTYFDPKSRRPPKEQRWLWQSTGVHTDWRTEAEYRHHGDLDLTEISDKDLILFCRFHQEAENLQREFGLKTISLLP